MRYPDATWKPAAKENYAASRAGKQIKAVCLHITAGPVGDEERSAIRWFQNPASGVSAHFVNGPSGALTQMVELEHRAFANGITYYRSPAELPSGWAWQGAGWYTPRKQRVLPTWQLITAGVNPNLETIAIEHAGQPGTPHPAAQVDATVAFLRWAAQQWPQLAPYVVGRTLIGHHHLDPRGRANCPGPLMDLPAIAAAANAPTRRFAHVLGLPIYQDSKLTRPSGQTLPPGSVVAIDRVAAEQPADYAPSAGHLESGAGFIDMNGTEAA